ETGGAEPVAERLRQALVGSEHDAEEHGVLLAAGAVGETARDPAADAVGGASEAAATSDHAPAVTSQDDVDAVSAQEGLLVESVLRTAGLREHAEDVEDISLARSPARGQVEQDRLGEAKGAETLDDSLDTKVERRAPGRRRHDEARVLGGSDQRLERA